jgi:CelD/BcsL family acetyltransferase involved in cellulose biosynthesis
MSRAMTGCVPPGVNGDAAAAVRLLAKSKPVVACKPMMVAPCRRVRGKEFRDIGFRV